MNITKKIGLTLFSGEAQAAQGTEAAEAAPQPEESISEENMSLPENEALPDAVTQEEAPEDEEDERDIPESVKTALLASRTQSIKQTWREDAEKLKEIYPSFDIRRELDSSSQFGLLLRAGVPVRSAYEAAHIEEIITAAMQYAARRASEKTANSIMTGTARPAENGIMNSAPSVTRTDVRSLTEKDILKILDRVSRGETVSF